MHLQLKRVLVLLLLSCLLNAFAIEQRGPSPNTKSTENNKSRTPAKIAFPLYTKSRYIIDSNGERVKFKCVNWSGAHMLDFVVGGLHLRTLDEISKEIYNLGFNCVRLQWSLEMYYNNPPVPLEAVRAMPELAGAPALEVYILTVKTLAKNNIMTIIDNHMSDAGWCCNWSDGNGLWYTNSYSEESWIEAWKGMVKLFINEPWAVAVDLRNELRPAVVDRRPHVPSWGTGDNETDWHMAATKVSKEILGINPNLLVIVQGLFSGKLLVKVPTYPIVLPVPNKLVYSAHDYKWFHILINWDNENEFTYQRYRKTLDAWWGFVTEEGQPYTAPVWVGEIGTAHSDEGMNYWWKCLTRYLIEKDLDFAYWPIDGTQSRGEGREFGAEEIYGILNTTWNGIAYEPHYQSIKDVIDSNKEVFFS